MWRIKKIILFAIVFFFLIVKGVSAKVIVVNQTSPACNEGDVHVFTIPAAVNLANPGDEIFVCKALLGEYKENIVLSTSNLTFNFGEILTAKVEDNPVFEIRANNITFYSPIIRGATNAPGIFINGMSGGREFTVSSCYIYNNSIGIYSEQSDHNHIECFKCYENNISGILLNQSNNNEIVAYIRNNTDYGLRLINSHNNTLNLHELSHNENGASLENSNNNFIFMSMIKNNRNNGLSLTYSNNNTIYTDLLGAWNNGGNGIFLNHSNNNSIFPLTIVNNTNGLSLTYSNNNTISVGAVIKNRNNGILLNYSHNNIIKNSGINSNEENGILLEYSNNNTINGTIIFNNTQNGILLRDSNNNTIAYFNITINKLDGISAGGSDNNTIEKCDVYNNSFSGIFLDNSDNNIIRDNSIQNNGNQGPSFGGMSGIFLDNHADNNTIIDNYISLSTRAGINLEHSHDNKIIHNNIFDNGDDGICLCDADRNKIINGNDIRSNRGDEGIHFYENTDYNVIRNNTIHNNKYTGITLGSGLRPVCTVSPATRTSAGTNNIIHNNTIYMNGENVDIATYGNGISIRFTSGTIITNNTIRYNPGDETARPGGGFQGDGILLFGIVGYPAVNNVIGNNTIEANARHGIHLRYSSLNTIRNNTIIHHPHVSYIAGSTWVRPVNTGYGMLEVPGDNGNSQQFEDNDNIIIDNFNNNRCPANYVSWRFDNASASSGNYKNWCIPRPIVLPPIPVGVPFVYHLWEGLNPWEFEYDQAYAVNASGILDMWVPIWISNKTATNTKATYYIASNITANLSLAVLEPYISCPYGYNISYTPAGQPTMTPNCTYDGADLICYDLPVEVSNETNMNVLTITQRLISCGDTITTDITLTADITNCTGHGIIIGADNIVLDCAGHTIAGMDAYNTYGVKNIDPGYANVTVKNCIVRDFEQGIYFGGTTHGNIINNTVVSNTDSGIRLYQSSSNQITNSVASNNGYGIMLFSGSSNNRIINCNLTDNDWDLAVKPLSDEDCNNKLDGVIGSNNLPIKYFNSSTTLSNEILSGIIFCNADYSNITNITINASQTKKNNVFYVARTEYSNFTQITSSENWMGLFFFYSSNNQVKDSIFSNNIVGILVGIYSSNNIIYNNLFNNTNNFQMLMVETNQLNTSRQAGKRIYSPGTEIGGNYWTNPSGNGYSDTCTDFDKDGFCDEPYTLAENNTDYLPLVYSEIPIITILSPTNDTFYPYSCNPLTYTVNEPTSWVGYSLDGATNKTLTGNTTLCSGYGSHNIVIFANDTSGNMNKSNTVYFKINSPPYPPSKPVGPTTGVTGTNYCYSSSTTDPDGDPVTLYFWDWGDGWSSTSSGTACHKWYTVGLFRVTVKARDYWGAMSGLSALSVTITNPSCTCTEWQPTFICCGSRLRPMEYWTRTCTPSGCDKESKCEGFCFV